MKRAVVKYKDGTFRHNIREKMGILLLESSVLLGYLVVTEERIVSNLVDCWILRPGIYCSDRLSGCEGLWKVHLVTGHNVPGPGSTI